ncbi:stage III sporulation protein SpoIIIAB [Shouchella lehensis]|uniref:Stage III sporulation protein AB n=2 Tax=Shouchella lehensis TaxID=300825 RepID=A0A060M3B6_9BACI|nr:stage III sporulation protein SpoIIIAB [Shouchella lehensis]AIC95033.1 stage III sporulation protein AB [Shouchella lehensis G1]MBG9784130.1 stage III sporulation protein SpoAB [Shouchella lehensis]TES50883.1 stage III sporulation protein SpoAB [Shouchella lehensis]
MRWLGALLIICCTTLYGFYQARLLQERPQHIRQLRSALQSLEAEIVYGQTPLAKASINISKQLNGPVAALFKSFSLRLTERKATANKAWEAAIEDTWKSLSLKEKEKEVLLQFGATIGTMDRNHQQKQLKLTQTHLERDEEEARVIQARYEKMYKTLGVLAGLFIVILMM